MSGGFSCRVLEDTSFPAHADSPEDSLFEFAPREKGQILEYLVPSPPRSVAPAPAFPGLGPGVHCSGHGLDLVANLGIIYTIVCSGLAAIPDQPELRGAASVFGVAGSAAPEQGHLAEDVGPPDQGEPEGATAHEEVLPDRGTVLEASKAAAFTVFEGPSSDESAEFWFFRGPVDM